MHTRQNHTLKALNIPFKKVFLPGKVKCDGTEGEVMVAHGCRKTQKLICGTEGEIVVAHGRLPSLTLNTAICTRYSFRICYLYTVFTQLHPLEQLILKSLTKANTILK